MTTTTAAVAGAPRKAWYRQLWTQVLIGMDVGILPGWRYPGLGAHRQMGERAR
jgi:Na+/H+-dicarboxylate symporter